MCAADEEAAIEAVLFLRDPLAAFVTADENDVRWRTARWRFDDLHFVVSFTDGTVALARQSALLVAILLAALRMMVS
jgi:hypothetical protein